MAKTYLIFCAITALMVINVESSINAFRDEVFERQVRLFSDEILGKTIADAYNGLKNMVSEATGLVNDPKFGPCAADVAALAATALDVALDLSKLQIWAVIKDVINIIRTKNAVKNDCKVIWNSPNDPRAAALQDEFQRIENLINAIKHHFHISDSLLQNYV